MVSAIVVIAHYIPSLSLAVRRLHDTDRSGWFILLYCIPLVGLIAWIVFGCLDSTPTSNRFGDPVKNAQGSGLVASLDDFALEPEACPLGQTARS